MWLDDISSCSDAQKRMIQVIAQQKPCGTHDVGSISPWETHFLFRKKKNPIIIVLLFFYYLFFRIAGKNENLNHHLFYEWTSSHSRVSLQQKFKTHTQKNQKMLLCKPSLPTLPQIRTSNSTPRNPNKRSLSIITTNSTAPTQRRRTMSAFEARISLVFALASQASSLSQRRKCPTPIPFFTLFFHNLYAFAIRIEF